MEILYLDESAVMLYMNNEAPATFKMNADYFSYIMNKLMSLCEEVVIYRKPLGSWTRVSGEDYSGTILGFSLLETEKKTSDSLTRFSDE